MRAHIRSIVFQSYTKSLDANNKAQLVHGNLGQVAKLQISLLYLARNTSMQTLANAPSTRLHEDRCHVHTWRT